MKFKIRNAHPDDFDRLEQILLGNNMLPFPEVDGKEAMQRVYEKMGDYFLVAESQEYPAKDPRIIGMIRGCYDGSRAVIHQLSIDKEYQRKGAGKNLINTLLKIFKQDSAHSVSVTSDMGSKSYYDQLGFTDFTINLMVSLDINKIIKNTN